MRNVALAVAAALVAVAAFGATVDCPAVADAYIYSATPDTNYGSATLLYLGEPPAGFDTYRIYIKFDVSSVPHGSNITNAIARLWVPSGSGYVWNSNHSYNEYRLTDDWSESTITWNNRPIGAFHEGTYTHEPTGGSWYDIPVFAGTVYDWVNGYVSNYGVYFGPHNSPSYCGFCCYSREYSSSTYRPYLRVTYVNTGVEPRSVGRIKVVVQ